MSEEEKPLPRPPSVKRRFEGKEKDSPLMADRISSAMAEGRLDEFMREEMPDNDYARMLADMMMGMTGMMPPGEVPSALGKQTEQSDETEGVKPQETPAAAQPPADVVRAVQSGDVNALMGLLRREHEKRLPGEEPATPAEAKDTGGSTGLSDEEKETLDQIIRIATENKVSVDWMVLRALKLYIREYGKTGRL